MLDGPFPPRGLTRGISDGTLVIDPRTERTAAGRRADPREPLTVRPDPGRLARRRERGPRRALIRADPDDPAYHFALIDTAVREAVAGGLKPVLVVSHAPAFAEAPGRWPYAYPGSSDPAGLPCGASPKLSLAATTARSPIPRLPAAPSLVSDTCRPGTSPTWPVTWSLSGLPGTVAGRPSRRSSTAACSMASTPASSRSPRQIW